jgi:sulfur carrier protein ThiS adenylyltransferase
LIIANEEVKAFMSDYMTRYSAQLPVVGESGQAKIRQSHWLFASLGGLGNTTAHEAAIAGVRKITGVDPQRFSVDNSNRCRFGSPNDSETEKVLHVGQGLTCQFPGLEYHGIVTQIESCEIDRILKETDIIVSSPNTLFGRQGATDKAVKFRNFLIDLSVADARHSLRGFVKTWHPEMTWQACPACFLPDSLNFSVDRGEALFNPIISMTAALGVYLGLQFVTGHDKLIRRYNYFELSLDRFEWVVHSIAKRDDCPVCGAKEASNG